MANRMSTNGNGRADQSTPSHDLSRHPDLFRGSGSWELCGSKDVDGRVKPGHDELSKIL